MKLFKLFGSDLLKIFIFTVSLLSFFQLNMLFKKAFAFESIDIILGPKVNLRTHWTGDIGISKSTPFLIMAGHSDSQGISGAGTSGEAVDVKGFNPMDPKISDELFWNILIRDEIVRLGKKKGLKISSYDAGNRNITDGNDSRTNWTVGAKHALSGGYPLEIHFDSYGEYGFGSGLIPAMTSKLNNVDESLANSFGRYPLFFRGGLGGPRRGIRILEIGKLEGDLEKSLRDDKSQEKIINLIAEKVVNAILLGINSE